jgi:MoaA/NifB/PqqE/SkfB family radical SAM enzyme
MLKEQLVSYDPETGRLASPPRHLFLELSSRCNLNCAHCSKDFGSDVEEGHPKLDLDGRVLESLGPWLRDTRFVNLNIVGESMVSPHFWRAIELASEGGAEVALNSNGILINERAAARFVELGLNSLTLSIDGVEFNARLRGVSYATLRERLMLLESAKRARGAELPHLGLAYTLMRSNLHELPRLLHDILPHVRIHAVHVQPLVIFYDFLRDENIYGHPDLDDVLAESRAIASAHGTGFSVFRSTLDEDESAQERRERTRQLGPSSETYGCIDPFFELKIRSTGDLMACSWGLSPGLNITERSPEEIWNSDWYCGLRRRLYAGCFEEECASCPCIFGSAENQTSHIRAGEHHSAEARFFGHS